MAGFSKILCLKSSFEIGVGKETRSNRTISAGCSFRGCGFSLFLDELSSTFFSSDLEDLGFKAGFITVWGLTTGAATSSTFF